MTDILTDNGSNITCGTRSTSISARCIRTGNGITVPDDVNGNKYLCFISLNTQTREPGWFHTLQIVAVGGKGPNVRPTYVQRLC